MKQLVYCCRRSATGRLAVTFVILLLTLGVVGVGTWGLTDSIKNTDHQVDTAWGIVSNASATVSTARDRLCCSKQTVVKAWPLTSMIMCLQVQSIATLATGIFSELNQLSPTLVAVSKTLVGRYHIDMYHVEQP